MDSVEIDTISQQNKIRRYIEEHGQITIREAFEKLRINSPSKRLSEMRAKGLIREANVPVYGLNAKGKRIQKTHYTVYTLAV